MANKLIEDGIEKLSNNVPEIVKENKGALIGALVGYFISDNEKAKAMILTAVAGALIVDKKKEDE